MLFSRRSASGVVSSVQDGLAERNHELRAALFGIEASAAGLCEHRDRLTDGQIDELMDGLLAEIRRVRALFDGRRSAAMGTFDLGDALRPVVACAQATGLDVSFFLPPGVEVEGRRDSAAQVLVALLDNVRRHASCSPVDVRVAVLDDAVVVVLEDRGPGIPAMSASGRVRVGSVRRGEHRFGARLAHRPPADDRAGRVDRGPSPPGWWHVVRAAVPARVVMTARVLIVEDHALVAIGLQLALSARGWEVETTDGPTAADVVEHARRFEPQVVLCDINLGEGWAAASTSSPRCVPPAPKW